MKPKVYLETSVISYLTGLPSRDLITAGHQQITHHWWETRKKDFHLFISDPVMDDASLGDPKAVESDYPLLEKSLN